MSRDFSVLVVDDERPGRETIVRQLRSAGYTADGVANAFVALERLEVDRWEVVITDLRMPLMDGLSFLKELKGGHPEVEVIILTGFGTVETAVEAMQEGAADYLTKPFKFEELHARLQRLARMLDVREELVRLKKFLADSSSTCGLVVQSPAMWQVWDRVQLFAEHDTPVLVLGETGTGKELVARAIHQLSARGSGPVVAVASGAVPRDLAESEFFGHEKGAFTGALRLRMGSFERADGGSLLLDDVDDLPLDIQVKLLRVLQEGRIQRVGGNREITVDVRVIATSKVKLQEAVAAGRFREDLYYRLRGLEIILPPLRDRGDEVLVLAQHFLRELGARQGTEPKSLSVAAAESLRRHSWPGNVRELRRVMESATALCRGPEISPAHLPEALSLDQGVSRLFTLHLDNSAELAFQDLVQQVEDELVDWAVRKAAGRQNRAAEILGLPRTTFQTKLGRRKAENSD